MTANFELFALHVMQLLRRVVVLLPAGLMLDDREFATVDWKKVHEDLEARRLAASKMPGATPPDRKKVETQADAGTLAFAAPKRDGITARSIAKQISDAAEIAEISGDAYHSLIADGAQLLGEDDAKHAALKFQEAIQLDPENPTGYFNLAVARKRLNDVVEAGAMYLLAQDSLEKGSEHWAIATARAFGCLVQPACEKVEKPSWWNDEDLKKLSAQLVEAAPEECETWHMRARVLSAMPGHPCAWEPSPRTAAELQEAAEGFRRAGYLTPIRENAPGLADQAEEALRLAVEQIDREIAEEEKAAVAAAQVNAYFALHAS